MKKILILLCLFLKPNLFANGGIQKQNNLSKPKTEDNRLIELLEIYSAIDKIDVSKVNFLINNQVTLNKFEKNILLKKIDSLIYSNKKSAIVKLLFGVPLTGIGINFIYQRFKIRQLFRGYGFTQYKNQNVSIIDDSFKEILVDQLFFGNYGKITSDGYVYYNLPVLILVTLSMIKGSQLIIDGLKKLVFKLENLKEIQKLIQRAPV